MLSQARRFIYTGSIGKVVATYAPLESSARPSIFSKDGIYERFFRFKNLIRNSLSSMYLQRTIRDFSRPKFLKEASDSYVKFINSYQKSDSSTLRSLCSPNLYDELCAKIKNATSNANYSVSLTSPPRIVQILPMKLKVPQLLEIFQITVQFEYHVNGHKMKDFVVFERSASSTDSKWKICGNIQPNSNYYKTL